MLKRLFGSKKPKSVPAGLTPLNSTISNSILNVVGNKSIPSMPRAAQKAFELSTNPAADALDFIQVIESDEALSSRVIKIANSVYFDRGKKSNTIEEAVTVIGINELRSLLNANTLSEIFPSKHPIRAQMWANDIATAIIGKSIAQQLVPSMAEIAFLGGLMHDIGKLLLLQRNPDEYVTIYSLVESQGLSFSDAEAQRFPFDHTEVGQLIGERWNFSPELLEIIRNHHMVWDGESGGGVLAPLPSMVTIIKCADTIAHALGLGHPKGLHKFRSRCEDELPHVWNFLNIPETERQEQLMRWKRTFETERDLYTGQEH